MTLTRTTDHETALAAGFDIFGRGDWARPDNAAIRRTHAGYVMEGRYRAQRPDGAHARFYTMAEAVAWIGPVNPDWCDHAVDGPCPHYS